jgi:hypothetical protein
MFQIKAGQPLAHLIPLTEKKVSLKHHLITREEFDSKFRNNNVYLHSTKESKRLKSLNKCPFGFGK